MSTLKKNRPTRNLGESSPNLHRRVLKFQSALLRWSDQKRNRFFWRHKGVDAFSILIVETLLTRTRADAVEPVASKLLDRFSQPQKLARAKVKEVERILFPLGLHRKRAAQLLACAKQLASSTTCAIPTELDELMQLPSVGRYVANAVLCFGFNQHRAVLDCNVARIYERVFSIPRTSQRLSAAHRLWRFAESVIPNRRTKQFNWAVLDLGREICTVRQPLCAKCPVSQLCNNYNENLSKGLEQGTRFRSIGRESVS
jgi:A/G-specific adenine glycosylase